MTTKERILAAALDLYNQDGIRTVTTRHIAAKLGISAGNLHYHFKRTEDIIKVLFSELADSFGEMIENMEYLEAFRNEDLSLFIKRSYTITFKYRFIFLHFVEIGNWIPEIREVYAQLMTQRELRFLQVLIKFRKLNLLKMHTSDASLTGLVRHMFIISDFWLSANALTNRYEGEKALEDYSITLKGLFTPYLI